MSVPDPSRLDECDPLGDFIRIDVLNPLIPLMPSQEQPDTPETNDPDVGDEPEEE